MNLFLSASSSGNSNVLENDILIWLFPIILLCKFEITIILLFKLSILMKHIYLLLCLLGLNLKNYINY